jgi:hypothetical protein
MACYFSAHGTKLDIDRLVDSIDLDLDGGHTSIVRRGEPTLPKSQPLGKKYEKSGVVVCVSDAGFDEFDQQIEDAIELLDDDKYFFQKIVGFDGVEESVVSFGIRWRDTVTQTDRLPARLVRLVAEIGSDLEVFHVPENLKPPPRCEHVEDGTNDQKE